MAFWWFQENDGTGGGGVVRGDGGGGGGSGSGGGGGGGKGGVDRGGGGVSGGKQTRNRDVRETKQDATEHAGAANGAVAAGDDCDDGDGDGDGGGDGDGSMGAAASDVAWAIREANVNATGHVEHDGNADGGLLLSFALPPPPPLLRLVGLAVDDSGMGGGRGVAAWNRVLVVISKDKAGDKVVRDNAGRRVNVGGGIGGGGRGEGKIGTREGGGGWSEGGSDDSGVGGREAGVCVCERHRCVGEQREEPFILPDALGVDDEAWAAVEQVAKTGYNDACKAARRGDVAWLKRIYPPFGFGPPCDDGGEGEGEGEGAETTHEAASEATSGGGKGTGHNGAPLESPGGGGVGGVETKKDTVATASGHGHAHAQFTVALDPWAQDGRPLIAAAGHGKEGAVRFLLSQGLSPDGSSVLSTKKVHSVYSGQIAASNTAAATAAAEAVPRPLVRAARFGHTEVVRMLLEAGADPTLNDVDELTAVAAAAQFGWVSVLVQLPRALLLHRRHCHV